MLFLQSAAFALDVPLLQGRVNDYAGILSQSAVQDLERTLADFERSDSTQIVLLTIPSLEGEVIEEFGIKVGEAWKIGQKGSDNGAILIVAKQERKIRIEVGRGLEGKLTDLVSGRIIRDIIAPRFKAGDFDTGVKEGVAAMIATVRGEFKASPTDVRHKKKSAPPIITFLVFLAVGCVFLGAINRYLGGAAGAVGLPAIAYFSYPGLKLLMLGGLGILGFVAGLILSMLIGSGGGGYGGGGYWWGGYGGGSSGGGDSGGDGGFSGGGGDFGGGGASDDW